MSYQTLYRKWRPQTFSDVIGQSHVTETLSRAIKLDRLSHAYLFSGPRGTGKTTTARILAKAVNCIEGPTATPCLKCEACLGIANSNYLDLTEIDAASHRRVEETRQLLEMIPFSPSHGRKRVFIIDEVHMLTPESFNTLLKTLEEPPDHVLFILATTDPQHVLPTVVSRCQRFDFRGVPSKELAAHLRTIAEGESIHIDDAALMQVARAHGGSVRDAVGTLEQLYAFCPSGITSKDVSVLLGTTEYGLVFEAVDVIESGSTAAVIKYMRKVSSTGTDLRHFVHDLCRHFRDLALLAEAPEADQFVEAPPDHIEHMKRQAAGSSPAKSIRCARRLQQGELDIRATADPVLFTEVLMLELANDSGAPAISVAPAPQKATPSPQPRPAPAPPKPPEAPMVEPAPVAQSIEELRAQWPQALGILKQMGKSSIAAYLGQARIVDYDGKVVTIGVKFQSHVDRMQASNNTEALQRVFRERLTGKDVRINFILDQGAASSPAIESDKVYDDPGYEPPGGEPELKKKLDDPTPVVGSGTENVTNFLVNKLGASPRDDIKEVEPDKKIEIPKWQQRRDQARRDSS